MISESVIKVNRGLRISDSKVARYNESKQCEEINRYLDSKIKSLKSINNSGISASQLITSDDLMKIPGEYFARYFQEVDEATQFVQGRISLSDDSDIIAKSQNNPTDNEFRENAFNVIKKFTLEYLQQKKFLTTLDRVIINQFVTNEIIGFSVLDPLRQDTTINEIAVDGPKNVRIERSGIWYRVQGCQFRDADHMSLLMERLFRAVNKNLSRMTPDVQGRLHDFSRLKGIHQSIMPNGPSLNIRRHPESRWTPKALVNNGTASAEVMTDIGNFIYHGCSYLVAGSTSTGKTSMLNALSGFYRNNVRIITIEDSLELQLDPTKMLVPGLESTMASPDGTYRGVDLRQLIRNALLMAPNVIVVGEAKGGEAYDLCQALNTGHAGAATLHGDSARHVVNERLFGLIAQSGIVSAEAALPMISTAFDFVIFLEHSAQDGTRKIAEVAEVPSHLDFDASGRPYIKTKPIWLIDHENHSWRKVDDISDELKVRKNLSPENYLTWEQLQELSKG